MKIKSICIVGGGSAGWMTAVALLKKTKDIKITLVESKDLGTIGVGEATQPLVLTFINEYLGFKETDWMPYCDATYKAAIRFNNFMRKENDSIYHTFWTVNEEQHNVYDWSVKQFLDPKIDPADYAKTFFASEPMCETSKFSKLGEDNDRFMYAHHMDATKFGEFSKEHCLENGIEYVVGTVTDINMSDSEDIKSLIIDNDKKVEADFFIDCTGFASVLLGRTLGVPFNSELDELPNDRAIATRVPYISEEFKRKHIPPYTDSTAVSCGWVWNIPLWSRIGTGIVYSSKFTTDDEAEEEFKKELKRRFGQDITKDLEFRRIKMRVGQHEQVWKNNCLAIGLSAQFIEPLESTGLVFTVNQIRTFTDQLVSFNNEYSKVFCDRYNQVVKSLFQETKDFIRLHYVNTARDDTDYWKFFKNQPTGDSLLKSLTNIAEKNDWNVELNKMFSIKSWEHIVVGCGILNLGHNLNISRSQPLTLDNTEVIDEVLHRLEDIKKFNHDRVDKMSSHYDYLAKNIYNI